MRDFDNAVSLSDSSQFVLELTQGSVSVEVDWRFSTMTGVSLICVERFQAIEHGESLRAFSGQIDLPQTGR
ncbi:hypothetical protein WI36_25480 [Burkholderia ubonensis]|nr:hypothetical protein WI36_25480 [Burkholderia ubonensis]KVA06480.1 hypothetical protein WI42_25840 [Burkholderia ubonensis]KVA30936.1 hypothetical protein WI43_33245 [Burkholderia ubonensis]KVA40603.1 hypothetical protein WI46_12840 [Burkholderia ubonensis]KVC46094.1 hypothetical protein WI72_32230 [Burkholderia ubonensis]